MSSRARWVPLAGVVLLLAACTADHDRAGPIPSFDSTPRATPTGACLAYAGPPDGSVRHPYLKRAMALDCREDVQRLQTALGITSSGHFDNATAAAVIAKQKPYPCIKANDGQVGPQTWSLIVEGIDPCTPGGPTSTPQPTWANCNQGLPLGSPPLLVASWALRTADGTVVRRCDEQIELVHEHRASRGDVQELGSTTCAQFEEGFGSAARRKEICISDPGAIDRLEADDTAGAQKSVWQDDVTARYVQA